MDIKDVLNKHPWPKPVLDCISDHVTERMEILFSKSTLSEHDRGKMAGEIELWKYIIQAQTKQ